MHKYRDEFKAIVDYNAYLIFCVTLVSTAFGFNICKMCKKNISCDYTIVKKFQAFFLLKNTK